MLFFYQCIDSNDISYHSFFMTNLLDLTELNLSIEKYLKNRYYLGNFVLFQKQFPNLFSKLL